MTTGIALLGIPYDEKSSYLRGAAEAPACIREALTCPATNTWSESGLDVSTVLTDLGDCAPTGESAFNTISDFVRRAMAEGSAPLVLGGDHSISYPVLIAVAERFRDLTIVHFDAHPDLYDSFEGDRFSHACPFARIIEGGLANRVVQIGIRSRNAHLRAQAARFGVETIEARDWRGPLPPLKSPVYISFDMDVLDPAFAPGIAHYEAGGLSTREAISAIQSVGAQVIGADLVEFNPQRDINGVTAMCAGKLVKELAAKMAEALAHHGEIRSKALP